MAKGQNCEIRYEILSHNWTVQKMKLWNKSQLLDKNVNEDILSHYDMLKVWYKKIKMIRLNVLMWLCMS